MELLIFLAEKIGQLVTRDEVAARAVAEWHLGGYRASHQQRHPKRSGQRCTILPRLPRYLETVVGKGYRLIGDLEVIVAGPPPVRDKMMPRLSTTSTANLADAESAVHADNGRDRRCCDRCRLFGV